MTIGHERQTIKFEDLNYMKALADGDPCPYCGGTGKVKPWICRHCDQETSKCPHCNNGKYVAPKAYFPKFADGME